MEIFTQEHLIAREKYGTTKQAELILENMDTRTPNDRMIKFIENMNYFFLATSSKDGRVNVNFKGTKSKSLIKFLDKNRLIFPDFDGNGILHSVGDIESNPHVGLLIIDFLNDIRIKINGKAKIIDDKNEIINYLDIFDSFNFSRLIEVQIEYIIPNCSANLSVVRNSILRY
ncbi:MULTISPECIES: pyridoxamine 5'-phosphate oxidase family protein [Arcobacter]|uniref:Pyridoxamine 5'-phosphate oxidase n=1 Tax=Arcobacter defluvii TaxID=873191 RepID=A0AAE7BFQ4_9BACT|nr:MULTISPECIES: pyridoxamine 5'-phosphate oxidase family protein [Arcobacter]QKF77202.1 pyridoxamine 5'-phosphate oxidase [Arcobacter defluvii]RXI33508.1 pyridoxamine 5'-phosphate oxidase family protein [Arcobacter defluvii]BAK73082.1 pyridoxamine 5'-phosphate oxidase [Arcobacter sp. L]